MAAAFWVARCHMAVPVVGEDNGFHVGVAPVLAVEQDRGFCFFGMFRPVVVYIGCTWPHLPDRNGIPPLPKAVDAIPAIFAARIARSSLLILSRLK